MLDTELNSFYYAVDAVVDDTRSETNYGAIEMLEIIMMEDGLHGESGDVQVIKFDIETDKEVSREELEYAVPRSF